MKKINENTKVTLTFDQLKRLVKEAYTSRRQNRAGQWVTVAYYGDDDGESDFNHEKEWDIQEKFWKLIDDEKYDDAVKLFNSKEFEPVIRIWGEKPYLDALRAAHDPYKEPKGMSDLRWYNPSGKITFLVGRDKELYADAAARCASFAKPKGTFNAFFTVTTNTKWEDPDDFDIPEQKRIAKGKAEAESLVDKYNDTIKSNKITLNGRPVKVEIVNGAWEETRLGTEYNGHKEYYGMYVALKVSFADKDGGKLTSEDVQKVKRMLGK